MNFTGAEMALAMALAVICGFGVGASVASIMNIGSNDGALKLLIEGYNQRKNRELDMKAKWLNTNEPR